MEYEIKKEHLTVSSVNNASRAHLEFVFTRRMEYHVTNTFLQVGNILLSIFLLEHYFEYHILLLTLY